MVNLYNAYKEMLPNSISITFKGVANEYFIESIIELISNKLDEIEDDYPLRKKVYSVLVECLQNLCRYVENDDNKPNANYYDKSASIFSIESNQEGYQIATANFVEQSRVDLLKQWLDDIHSSTDKELKKMYNKILLSKGFNEKGGAGLGLIEIARKSGNNIEYDFDNVDDHHAFFYLKVNIQKKEEETSEK